MHLEATLEPRTLLRLARRNGVALPADSEESLAEYFRFSDFSHFIRVWISTTQVLRRAEDFRQAVSDYAARVASCGCLYVEAIVSPAERVRRGVPYEVLFEGCDGSSRR